MTTFVIVFAYHLILLVVYENTKVNLASEIIGYSFLLILILLTSKYLQEKDLDNKE